MDENSKLIPEKGIFRFNCSQLVTYSILSLWAIATIVPLAWILINSFKNNDEILGNAFTLPRDYFDNGTIFQNFETLKQFSENNIFRGFINSFIISGSTMLLVLLLGSMAAFVLARFKFRFTKQIKVYLVASMLIPQFAVIVPNFIIMRNLGKVIDGFQGSYLTVIIPQAAGLMSFAILIITSFMSGLPRELEEAAMIDGCSIPGIYWRIAVPLTTPAFISVGIMEFLWSYNDLLTPLVYLTKRNHPVTVLISEVQSLYSTDYGAMMAAILITVIPVLILYFISQEYVIKGMTTGAVKG
ncbi:MAG: binding-protein-dependent transport system inner rane component [Eubacterium sp.]|jgi:raffinose/stachyose/melibiose transport system permease protein|nr:binding-protein-dependent transport system inner rane component [Eubacterium sp.]